MLVVAETRQELAAGSDPCMIAILDRVALAFATEVVAQMM